ncbi:hypothetical protein Hypma_005192 [Hypsizygus marmoreus]|uniref:Uncharacterized protein n=1 Tax=Hypsizygus marmoreus TaxID=39966 RepID=A0A369J405_HYPMA|nr:hypothetical protein Hypma_005192 [Hypsizygus marmoreus]
MTTRARQHDHTYLSPFKRHPTLPDLSRMPNAIVTPTPWLTPSIPPELTRRSADALAEPDAVLQDLDAVPARVTDQFKSIFASDDAFNEIPPLTLDLPRRSTRTGPSRSGGRCGGWGLGDDATMHTDNIDYAILKECTVFWAVSVPGESPWTAPVADLPPTTPPIARPIPTSISPWRPHVGVQVKIYDAADSLRSTDVVTFVGILTSEPCVNRSPLLYVLTLFSIQADLELATLVPTRHVLFFQPVPPTIVPLVYPSPSATPELRDELITWIADEALAGDRDAAEMGPPLRHRPRASPPLLPLSQLH